jgi:hypothetical protein
MDKLKAITQMVIENLVFYDAPVNEVKVKMFAHELKDQDLEKIAAAFSTFRNEKGRRQMPMPADVKAKMNVNVSDDSLAIDAASRIVTAISRFGYTNTNDAKTYIGELGWRAVSQQGGWSAVCQSDSPIGVLQAQLIKLIKALLEKAHAGTLDSPPEIPRLEGFAKLGEVMKLMSVTKLEE